MTSIFPAQYSTLSAKALQVHLIEHYQLKPETTCRLLIRNVSDTYILENASEKFIFKIYRDAHRKLSEIEAEVELLNLLKADGHSVSYPISDRDGKQIQQFKAMEGIRNGILFSFAPGKVILDLQEDHLIELGRDMAQLHHTTALVQLKNKRPAFNFETTLFEPLKTLKPHLKEMPEEYLYLENLAQQVVAKFKEFDTENFSYGYCHYDFFPKNFHFDEGGKITFFDFDFAGQGFLINDLMTFLNHYFFHGLSNRISEEQATKDYAIFLTAYQSVKTLTEDEIKAIPYLGITFHLFFLKFFYDNYDDWSNIFLNPGYVKQRVEFIRKWVKQYCNF